MRSDSSFQKCRQITWRFRRLDGVIAGLLDHLVEQTAPGRVRRPEWGIQTAEDPGVEVKLIGMVVVQLTKLQGNARQTDSHPHSGNHLIQVVTIDRDRAPSSKFRFEAAIGSAAEIAKDQNPKWSVRLWRSEGSLGAS